MTQPNWVEALAEHWRQFYMAVLADVAPEAEWFIMRAGRELTQQDLMEAWSQLPPHRESIPLEEWIRGYDEVPFPFGGWTNELAEAWANGGYKASGYDPSVPLAERKIGSHDPTRLDVSPGRRLRVFACLVQWVSNGPGIAFWAESKPFLVIEENLTYGELLAMASEMPELVEAFSAIPLRIGAYGGEVDKYYAIPERVATRDKEIHRALQDLGDEINEDVREACFAFDSPDLYYPGVDEGIDPVSDEHIDLVIWALQRELNRELRGPESGAYGYPLPAAPLAELPRNIQRALVERRRFRYAQYGITHDDWERGTWSLWNIPEDPDWIPRRPERLLAN